MDDERYHLNGDIEKLKLNKYGVVIAPHPYPKSIECDQCPEQCFEEVGYMVTNGKLRAFIGCNAGGRVKLARALIEHEMNKLKKHK